MFNNKFNPLIQHPGYNDMGTAVTAGVSIVGGMMGDDAAQDSGGAANAGLAMGIEELRNTDARTLGQTQPYRDFGAGAVNKLSYLLGITDPTSQGQYNAKYGTLVDTTTGIPKPNMALYSSDPAYKSAWDEFQQMNYDKYKYTRAGGGAYTKDSDSTQIDRFIRSKLPGADSFSPLDTADSQYGSLMKKFDQSDLNNDVVYQSGLKFGLDNGNKAINNRALATGKFDSGESEKALTKWGNDYGSTKANESYGRFMNDKASTYGMLSGGVQTGQNAVNTSAQSGQAIGTAIAGAQGQIGANNAAATMGSANAWSGALGGLGNAFGDWWSKGQQAPGYSSIPSYTF